MMYFKNKSLYLITKLELRLCSHLELNYTDSNKMKKKIPYRLNNSSIKYQNRRKRQNNYPIRHKYMTAHYPGLVPVLQ